MPIVSISGLKKAAVYAALYNHAKRISALLARLDGVPADEITIEEAEQRVARSTTLEFEWHSNRLVPVNLSGDEFDSERYDMANPHSGGAEQIIDRLRKHGIISPEKVCRPLEPSEALCYLSMDEIAEAVMGQIEAAHEHAREFYNQG